MFRRLLLNHAKLFGPVGMTFGTLLCGGGGGKNMLYFIKKNIMQRLQGAVSEHISYIYTKLFRRSLATSILTQDFYILAYLLIS